MLDSDVLEGVARMVHWWLMVFAFELMGQNRLLGPQWYLFPVVLLMQLPFGNTSGHGKERPFSFLSLYELGMTANSSIILEWAGIALGQSGTQLCSCNPRKLCLYYLLWLNLQQNLHLTIVPCRKGKSTLDVLDYTATCNMYIAVTVM